MPKHPTRTALTVLVFVALTLLVSACAPFLSFPWPIEPPSTPLPFPGPSASANPVAVFDVVGETFRIELVGTDNLVHAQALLAGGTDAPIPSGLIVRGDQGVNAPVVVAHRSRHARMGGHDHRGLRRDAVADRGRRFTFERFCPWAAHVIAIEQADN